MGRKETNQTEALFTISSKHLKVDQSTIGPPPANPLLSSSVCRAA